MYVNASYHYLVIWLFYIVFQEVQLSEFLSATTLHLQAGSKSIKRKYVEYDLINFHFARFLTVLVYKQVFFGRHNFYKIGIVSFPDIHYLLTSVSP